MDEKQVDSLFARYVEHLVLNNAQLDVDELAGNDREVAAALRERIRTFQRVGEALQNRSQPLTGKTISRYRIDEKLGAGGMGDVYRAQDLQLGRQVALKFLPPAFAIQPDRRSRFEREARIMASLGHKNIAAIHGVESAEGLQFLVLELVEGETLADKIRAGPLPFETALPILKQIGDALEVAHSRGIVHRDLKPANVMITPAGQVKVLDFGLSKTFLPPDSIHSAETRDTPPDATATGVILGTAAYMSPEQARGQEVDRRTDVWSFGCVFYETVTGRKAFPGKSFTETLTAILGSEPDWEALPAETPESIRILLRRCLEKNLERRLRDLGDAAIEIEDAMDPSLATRSSPSASSQAISGVGAPASQTVSRPTLTKAQLAIAAAVLSAIAVIAGLVTLGRRDENQPPPRPTEHQQLTFVGNADLPAITPDGKFIAYITRSEGPAQVMMQEIDGGRAIQIAEAGYVWSLRWSPDGSRLLLDEGFGDARRTVIVPRLGGTPVPFGNRPLPAWSPDGARFASYAHGRTLTITGRTTAEETTIPLSMPGFQPNLGPVPPAIGMDWSPTGEVFAYVAYGLEIATLWTVGIDGGDSVKILEDTSDLASPRFSRNGDAIYYLRNAGHAWDLWKAPIVPDTGRPNGEPRFLVGGLESGYFFTLSGDDSRFLYTRRAESSHLWLARSKGSASDVETQQLTRGSVRDSMPNASPDGTRVAFVREIGDARNIFVSDIDGSNPTQLTFFQSHNDLPVWSPDGKEIAFAYDEEGVHQISIVPSSGGTPQHLPGTELNNRVSLSWAPGSQILYTDAEQHLVLLDPASGEKTTLPIDDSLGEPAYAYLSPDGRNVALVASHEDESALSIVVRDTGKSIKVWPDAAFPFGWTADGKGVLDLGSFEGHEAVVAWPVVGEDKEVIAELPFDGMAGYGSPLPDGRAFVFEVGQFQSDVWLMDHFDPSTP